MEVGRGFLVAKAGAVRLRGTLNSGNISYGVYNGPGTDDGYNLIGNPYASSLDATAFLNANSNINGTIYFWNKSYQAGQSSSDYTAVNGLTASTLISPMQGFFVEATASGSSNVQFTNSMRSTTATSFYRTGSIADLVYVSTANDSGDVNTTVIGFKDDATDAWDRMYDSRKLKGNTNLSFYSYLQGNQMAIQGFPTLDQARTVALGLEAGFAGNYKINIDSIAGLNPTTAIYLEDLSTQTMHNLRAGAYNFNLSAPAMLTNRFLLHFQPMTTAVNNIAKENQARVWMNGTELVVEKANSSDITSIEVIDLSGKRVQQFVVSTNDNMTRHNLSVADGIYSIRVSFENGSSQVDKVAVQR
jgi:hypothetical protein